MIISTLILLSSPQVPGGEWNALHRLSASQAEEKHGYSLDWLGDLDLDGCDDFVVASTGPFLGDPYRVGSFTTYSGRNGFVLARYEAQSLPSPGLIGNRVSRVGDVTGDGVSELAVHISGASGTYSRVVVFTLTPPSILYEVNSPLPPTDFGLYGIGGGTDLSGDGVNDFTVTDSTYNFPTPSAGAIHAFNGLDGSLLWTKTGGGTVTNLGYGVACPGDLDGDGHGDVIASSLQFGATVHVLSGLDGHEMYQLVGGYPYYGKGVANASGCGDADQDGLPDIILGAVELPGVHKGTVFVHRGFDGLLIHQWEGPRNDEQFGLVSGPGDVNGDGWPDFGIGAPEHYSTQGARGGIYLYSGRDLEPLALLESPAPVSEVFQFGGIPRTYTMGDANADGRMDILTSDFGEDPNGVSNAGSAYILSFDPFLTASTRQLAAAVGGNLQFQLDFPASESGRSYRLLASDDLPGSLTVGGVKVPLVWTALLQKFVNNPPPVFDYPTGTLDANGDAIVTATIPANALAAYVGRTVKFAAVSLLTPSLPSLSSAAAWIEVLP